MKFCSKCGKEIMDEAVICPNCGCEVKNSTVSTSQNTVDDQVSIGLCVLAVLIPLFGVIYWPLKHQVTPKKAQACGIAGIVSWVVSFILILLMNL